MNLFNRIFVTVVLLALAAGAISVAALAWTIPDESISGLRDAVDWLADNNEDLPKVLLTTAAALIALVALTLLMLEFVPSTGPDVKVTDVEAGNVVLSTYAIGQRVEEAVRVVPNVADVKAAVRARRKGVEVFLDLHVDSDANLAAVAGASCEAARAVLADKVHVALAGQPSVRMHYRELRLQRAGAGASRSAPAPQNEAGRQPAAPPEEPALKQASELVPPAEGIIRQDGV